MFLSHIWLIPLLPAFGATVMFFFGRRLQKATVSAVCVGTIVLAFIMACGAVWQYSAWSSTPENYHQPYQTILYTWLGTDTGHMNYTTHDGSPAPFQADAGFLLDPLSSIWLLFVTGVGMLIHIYSIGYMAHEGGYYRFFGYLNLFMFSMLTLVLANNYVLHVRRLGRGGAVFVSSDRVLFPSQVRQRCGRQGIHRQPHRRRRIPSWNVFHRLVLRLAALHRSHKRSRIADASRSAIRSSPPRLCFSSSEPAANRRSFRSTSGCPMPWKAPRRFPL